MDRKYICNHFSNILKCDDGLDLDNRFTDTFDPNKNIQD